MIPCILVSDATTYQTIVTDKGSVFESRTGQTEDEKLSSSFSEFNCERMSVGYVAELHSPAKRHCLEQSYVAVLRNYGS
jgi:hypothetical protein